MTSSPATGRDLARLEMPAPMRRDVRLLGDVLGEVLTEASGRELLDDVERLRRLAIAARSGRANDDELAALVKQWPLERAEQVARAFMVYFHLVNLAEEPAAARHPAWTICGRFRGCSPGPRPVSTCPGGSAWAAGSRRYPACREGWSGCARPTRTGRCCVSCSTTRR